MPAENDAKNNINQKSNDARKMCDTRTHTRNEYRSHSLQKKNGNGKKENLRYALEFRKQLFRAR